MSISSLSSSCTVQHTINNSYSYICIIITLWIYFCCICNFNQCIFWQNHYCGFTQISLGINPVKNLHVLAIFAYYAGSMLNAFAFLLCSNLCWHKRLNPIHMRVDEHINYLVRISSMYSYHRIVIIIYEALNWWNPCNSSNFEIINKCMKMCQLQYLPICKI